MIEVGEYYRTKKGLIRKVETIRSGRRQFTRTTETLINGKHKIEDIENHSKNKLDIIEKDDFVNGWQVGDFLLNPRNKKREFAVTMYGNFTGNEIKTILTKEQYEANCYKVKE